MPTININGNIRTNTAAGWAADTTIYSGKTILVTTDATYTGTDQRKFKIADGSQTWSNLDYFPADIIYLSGTTKTVQQSDVIAQWIGATNRFSLTNDNNAYLKAWIFMTQTSASYGFNDAWLEAATGYLYLKASNVNMFGEPDGDRILSLDTNKNIKGLDVSTYPDLTELSYIKGLTSAIQSQIDGKQPLDSDLTAIAALTTTAYGRGLLTMANAAALRTDLGGFGTSSGTFCEGNDSRLSDARYTKMFSYSNTDSSHTGSVAETILKAVALPLMGANDVVDLVTRFVSTGAAGTKEFRAYLSTSAVSIAGATQIGGRTHSTGNRISRFRRSVANKNSVSTNNLYTSATTIPNEESYDNTSAAVTTLNLDLSTQYYFVVTVILANSGDTGTCADIQTYWNKA